VLPVEMDWFLDPKRMPKDPTHGKNWETPQGVDFERLHAELKRLAAILSEAERLPEVLEVGPQKFQTDIIPHAKWAGRPLDCDPAVVVVEGFLLFYDASVCDMLNTRIWLEASFDTCLHRRHKRGKASRKRSVDEVADWFRDMVWANHTRNRGRQLENAHGCLRLDGVEARDDLLERARAHCRRVLEQWR